MDTAIIRNNTLIILPFGRIMAAGWLAAGWLASWLAYWLAG